jgi:Xaa-Pro aminopeptidase
MNNEKEAGKPKRISTAELNRRWQATRAAMKEAGLDFLLIENAAAFFSGHVRWFTDMTVADGDPTTVIFPRDDEMTTITHGGAAPAEPRPPAAMLRGVKKRISVPMLPSLKDTGYLNAEKAVAELKPCKNCRIGLVGMGFISVAFYQYVTSHLDTAKFVDATDLVDAIKVIKSDEEISLIRETCHMQDALFQYALTCVRAGRRNFDVQLDVMRRCQEMGGKNAMIAVGSAPAGSAAMIGPDIQRIIKDGDQVIILIENDGPGGFWGELARIICLGKVSPELEEQFGLAQQAQKVTLNLMKPGASPTELFNANNEFLRSHGYPEQNALYGHGQGYDIAERPGLDPYEKMGIQGRMNIAVHPLITSERAVGWVCENYLVTEGGANECLHQTPQKIFVL